MHINIHTYIFKAWLTYDFNKKLYVISISKMYYQISKRFQIIFSSQYNSLKLTHKLVLPSYLYFIKPIFLTQAFSFSWDSYKDSYHAEYTHFGGFNLTLTSFVVGYIFLSSDHVHVKMSKLQSSDVSIIGSSSF